MVDRSATIPSTGISGVLLKDHDASVSVSGQPQAGAGLRWRVVPRPAAQAFIHSGWASDWLTEGSGPVRHAQTYERRGLKAKARWSWRARHQTEWSRIPWSHVVGQPPTLRHALLACPWRGGGRRAGGVVTVHSKAETAIKRKHQTLTQSPECKVPGANPARRATSRRAWRGWICRIPTPGVFSRRFWPT